jgi:hypothetical protein
MSSGLLVSRDGADLIVHLPADPFSGSRWSRVHKPPRLVTAAAAHVATGFVDETRPPFSKIRLSEPVIATLTPGDAEEGSRPFVRDKRLSFEVVHFACEFKPADRERISDAILEVDLRGREERYRIGDSSNRAGYPAAIAWSMQPTLRSGGGDDRTTTVRIGADLKLVNVGIDHSRKSKAQICIQARGELTSKPIWTIKRTPAYKLDRDERFVLIVRRDRRVPLEMLLTLRAEGTYRGSFRIGPPYLPIRRKFSGLYYSHGFTG